MNETTTKELLYKIKEELEQEATDRALDFVGDYALEDLHYISDAFSEFADNNISMYYCDQFKYYEEHATECEDALLEFYDGESIAQKIKNIGLYNLCCSAGVCGMWNAYTGELYEQEETIKKLLVIRYIIKHDIFTLTAEQIEEILNDAEDSQHDTGEALVNLINEKIEEVEKVK